MFRLFSVFFFFSFIFSVFISLLWFYFFTKIVLMMCSCTFIKNSCVCTTLYECSWVELREINFVSQCIDAHINRVQDKGTAMPRQALLCVGDGSMGIWKGVGRGEYVGNKKLSRSVGGRGQGEEVSNYGIVKSGRGVCGLCSVVRDCVLCVLYFHDVSECVRMFR
jgi:hypothetical protein